MLNHNKLNIQKFLLYLIIFKLTVGFFYSFVGFVNPHIIRQAVTMAVNQRFVIDWKYNDKSYPLLPRSLAGGDNDAILEMEFPLLNYLTVPAFFLETPAARVVARLMYLFFMFWLWYFNYRIWKHIKILDISCSTPSLILILLPISGVYFHRFMPDFASFILCSIALGLSLNHPKKVILPLTLASLGLLTKPTAIIAFGPLLLLRTPLIEIFKRLYWLVPSILIMLVYYVFGTKWIRSLSDLERYYMTDFRNPWQSFIDFFSQPSEVIKLFLEKITTPYLPIVILIYWLFKKAPLDKVEIKLWGLLLFQFISIVLLDGDHSFIHDYYYIGISMTAALMWTYYYNKTAEIKWLQVLVAAPLVVFNVERSFYELRDAVSSRSRSVQEQWIACKTLKTRNPSWPWSTGYSFRSEITPVSEIGLCFGEIQGSVTSEYGFFYTWENTPQTCQIIDNEGPINLVKCQQ